MVLGRSRFSRLGVRFGADLTSRSIGLCFGRVRQDRHLWSRFPASRNLGPCAASPWGLVWLYVLEASSEAALSTGCTRERETVEEETPKGSWETGLTTQRTCRGCCKFRMSRHARGRGVRSRCRSGSETAEPPASWHFVRPRPSVTLSAGFRQVANPRRSCSRIGSLGEYPRGGSEADE